jgi:glyoxylase-like metal-dependent hydrolase (beta-lactamase superfamily II)
MTLTLEHLRGGTYYFSLKYTNAGIYMYKKQCVLIDTGCSEDEGKAIVEYMKSKGLTLLSILITHAHADNLAGAHYIKNKTKAKLYASKEESLVIENPKKSTFASIISELKEVEVADPNLTRDGNIDDKIIHFIPAKKKVMQHSVLKHEKCLVDGILVPGKAFLMEGTKHKIDIVGLPGHSGGQVGIVTPDKVFFIGDSLYSSDELSENPIPYSADVTKTKKTLDYLLKSKHTLFVPTHGKPLEFSITNEVYNNQRQIRMLEETILMHLSMPKTTDELVALVLASFEITENIPNFYMISSTISAYLEDLKKSNKLKAIHEKGKTRWFADF